MLDTYQLREKQQFDNNHNNNHNNNYNNNHNNKSEENTASPIHFDEQKLSQTNISDLVVLLKNIKYKFPLSEEDIFTK